MTDVRAPAPEVPGRPRLRTWLRTWLRTRAGAAGRAVLTAAAAILVWAALVTPETTALLDRLAFARLPIEGLVLAAAALALTPRVRGWVLTPVGVLLAVLLLVRVLDVAFRAVFYRPFNLLSDWRYARSGVDLVRDASGPGPAYLAAAAAGLTILGVLVAVPLALRRLARVLDRHRPAAGRAVGALLVVWVALSTFGVAVRPGVPVASWSTAALAAQQARKAVDDLQDRARFAAAIAQDPFRQASGTGLLSALQGKDVVVVFVESYGTVALEGSDVVTRTLAAGSDRLAARGFAGRSAWLTSPTFGGLSWLAHSTLHSGLWVDTQQRYDQLLATDRLTLARAFSEAGWRTVDVVPANRHDWPEGVAFYGYDTVLDSRSLGYRGPGWGYAPMPDQFTLSAFDRLELARPGPEPVMAEVDLVTSHVPWAPLPRLVDWSRIGDGSVYESMAGLAPTQDAVWRTPQGIRSAYLQSIAYSLDSVFSFLEHSADDNLVVLVLGDHQPASVVSGDHASHDVPVTLISKDRAVLARAEAWGWVDGLRPADAAPVWPMDRFRDRFLTAFSSAP